MAAEGNQEEAQAAFAFPLARSAVRSPSRNRLGKAEEAQAARDGAVSGQRRRRVKGACDTWRAGDAETWCCGHVEMWRGGDAALGCRVP